MNKKTITPNPQQPVDRKPTGQLPNALAELSEAALSGSGDSLSSGAQAAGLCMCSPPPYICSYDGGDDE
ncbi:MAG: DUF5837 family cyanobactin class RiPP [Cyanobacteriota bacterium]|nr:DUF5837 family cyanobactin class RiPP [Cyanobacteriota bacterium]